MTKTNNNNEEVKDVYLNLFEQIYNLNEPLRLEPLGIEFRNLDTLTLASLLLPILNVKVKYNKAGPGDATKMRIIHNMKKFLEKEKLVRIGFIGADASLAFDLIKTEIKPFTNKELTNIIRKEEVYFTIKVSDISKMEELVKMYNIIIISTHHNTFYKNNFITKEEIASIDVFSIMNTTNLRMAGMGFNLIYSLISSLGFHPYEIRLYDLIKNKIKNIYLDDIYRYYDSIFIESIIKHMDFSFWPPKHYERNVRSRVELLLEKYPIKSLINYTFEQAEKMLLNE